MSRELRNSAIFFVIAFGLTFAASQLPELAVGKFSINLLLWGSGPLLSGLLCYQLLKTKNTLGITLLGTRPLFSLLVCIVPLITVCFTQTKHDLWVIFLYMMIQLVYCFGEEFGWRHYLQNATNYMNEWVQSFLIGSLWYCWHYSFLDDLQSKLLGTNLPAWIFPPVMIVLLSLQSFLFGKMVKISRSILFPTAGHFLFKTGLTSMIITGCLMCVILVFWNKLPFGKRTETA